MTTASAFPGGKAGFVAKSSRSIVNLLNVGFLRKQKVAGALAQGSHTAASLEGAATTVPGTSGTVVPGGVGLGNRTPTGATDWPLEFLASSIRPFTASASTSSRSNCSS